MRTACDPDLDPLNALASLVDRSLLRAVDTGPGMPRYQMLETVREFAAEDLAASGEETAARQRHKDWCLALAKQSAPMFRKGPRPAEVTLVEAEHANLHVALTWLDESAQTAEMLKLAARLSAFWYLAGHLREGLAWLERAIERWGDEPAEDYAGALINAGHLALRLRNPGARAYLERGRALAHASGNIDQEALAADVLGMMAEDDGNYQEAEALLLAARTLVERSGYLWIALTMDYHLGVVAYGQDRLGDAGTWLRRRLDSEVSTSLSGGEEFCGAAAVLGAALGEWPTVAGLLGAASADIHDVPFSLPERTAFERAESAARQGPGSDVYEAGWDAGHRLRRAAIRAEIERLIAIVGGSAAPKRDDQDAPRVTAREREVLGLLIEGRSNREIAAAHFISLRTATTHVSNILAKFGVDTRAAAVGYAFDTTSRKLPPTYSYNLRTPTLARSSAEYPTVARCARRMPTARWSHARSIGRRIRRHHWTANASSRETGAMNTNLTAHYMAIETERARLPRLAERGWVADEANAAHRSLPTRRTLRGTFIGFLTSSNKSPLRTPQTTAVELH